MGFAVSDALTEAQELYREALDALRDQRKQIAADIEFSDPSDPQQWEEDVKRNRENDPGGKRPCLVLDQCGQYVANVAGQVEKQPPALHAIPVGGGADKKAAEQLDGRFRHIEYASRAQLHYTRAMTSAARVGVGYLIVRPEYTDRALGYQEPRIGSEPDALKVVFDPWSTDTDGKDATFGYVMSDISTRIFEKRWGKKAQRDFGDLEASKRNDERKSVLVAEQWKKESKRENVIVFNDPNDGAEDQALSETEYWKKYDPKTVGYQPRYIRSEKRKTEQVWWRLMSGEDILEEQRDSETNEVVPYPSDHIGIIPIYGYVGFKDGRMNYCGIPRRARGGQQAYNYHMSELLVPNTMILMPERALQGAGVKDLWDKSRVTRRGFMPYTDFDDEGPVNQPSLMPMDSINHEQGAQQALRDIQASIGMYQANLGAPSNESSGVAIESRKEQGEASTAHFPSHLAASLGQVGQIVMQMDARLSDTRRMQPIIGVDQSAGQVIVDPEQKQAFKRGPEGVAINPKVGTYGVRVVIGASYSTQRTQTNAAFTEIIRSSKDPQLTATVLPFWAQTLDFPGSDKFAQAMTAMAPPAVKSILQPEGSGDAPDPAQMAQQLDQCKQALQEALQVAQEAQQEIQAAQTEMDGMKADAEIDWFKARTDRLKVTGANQEQVAAITEELVNGMLEPVMGQINGILNPPQPESFEGGQPMADAPMPEPQEPAPEIMALQQGQEQLAQMTDQLAQGQQQIAQVVMSLPQMLEQLAALTKRTRRRIPVRNLDGDITEVIDKMDEEPGDAQEDATEGEKD